MLCTPSVWHVCMLWIAVTHLSHVGVSMCAGYLMSSTKRLKSLGHRGSSAPTLVVLFYDCPFDSDRGSEGSRPREATAR